MVHLPQLPSRVWRMVDELHSGKRRKGCLVPLVMYCTYDDADVPSIRYFTMLLSSPRSNDGRVRSGQPRKSQRDLRGAATLHQEIRMLGADGKKWR